MIPNNVKVCERYVIPQLNDSELFVATNKIAYFTYKIGQLGAHLYIGANSKYPLFTYDGARAYRCAGSVYSTLNEAEKEMFLTDLSKMQKAGYIL